MPCHLREPSVAVLFVAICFLGPAHLAADASYLDDYESGHRALRYSSWDEAAFWFRRAAEKRHQDGGPQARLSGRNYIVYLPYYYIGFALFQGGRYSEALETWAVAERQWESEQWLTRSRGFVRYRESLAHFREQYETRILPQAVSALAGYLERVRTIVAKLKEEVVPQAGSGTAAEIAAIDARLPRWEANAATSRTNYREVIALTRELAQVLDRLEVIAGCASSQPDQPWCQPEEEVSSLGRRPGGLPAPQIAMASLSSSLLASSPAATGASVSGIPVRQQDLGAINRLYRKKLALLISPQYSHWTPIPGAEPRLRELGATLQQLGFEVKILTRALSKQDVETTIRDFIDNNAPLVTNQPNLLLLHFIGHGYPLDIGGDRMGLLVTSSTPPAGKSSIAAIAKEAVFEGFFQQFVARPLHHIVFTFETCASGRFLEELGGANPKDWRKAIGSPAFLILTAGDVQEVGSLDKLPLTEELTRALAGCGQGGKQSVLTGYLILDRVRMKVMNAFPIRSPQFKKNLLSQHRDGDFVLVVADRCSKPNRP